MNAIPLVTVAPIRRPTFENRNLGNPQRWALDNARALALYWHEQGNVLGLAMDDDTDFDFWLRVQHDIELKS